MVAAAVCAALLAGNWIFDRLRDTARVGFRAVPFTSTPGTEIQPAFSPDGSRVVFAWTQNQASAVSQLFVKPAGGGEAAPLTRGESADIGPAWSPDGMSVAFYREGEGYFTAAPDGSGERRLLAVSAEFDPGERRPVCWLPDSRTVVVIEPGDDETWRLARIDAGGPARPLTSPAAGTRDSDPAVSPDGSRIAFIRNSSRGADIFVVPVQGGEPRRVTFDDGEFHGLAWTAGGPDLVFSSSRHVGDVALWRIPAGGGTPGRLPGAGEYGRYPAVSMRGNRLAYSRVASGAAVWRYDLKAPGQAPQRLISSTRADYHPQYSPDGKRIVLVSDRSGWPQIWACDAAGNNCSKMTDERGERCVGPQLSPDGKYVAAECWGPHPPQVQVWRVPGGERIRLVSEAWTPRWSRDGRWLYFAQEHSIHKIRPDTGEDPVALTTQGGTRPQESYDGKNVYFERRGAIWSVPAGGGEAAELTAEIRPQRGGWMAGKGAIWYLEWETGSRRSRGASLRRYDLGKRTSSAVGQLPEIAAWGPSPFTISPDGRYVLFSRNDDSKTDLMMVEGFR